MHTHNTNSYMYIHRLHYGVQVIWLTQNLAITVTRKSTYILTKYSYTTHKIHIVIPTVYHYTTIRFSSSLLQGRKYLIFASSVFGNPL